VTGFGGGRVLVGKDLWDIALAFRLYIILQALAFWHPIVKALDYFFSFLAVQYFLYLLVSWQVLEAWYGSSDNLLALGRRALIKFDTDHLKSFLENYLGAVRLEPTPPTPFYGPGPLTPAAFISSL
jgi:hypothetical protein